jgi:phosphatidylethanolamine/phosphatidyl-N-methylethanolamine N-methyltransferase
MIDKQSVEHVYRRWAPFYDLVFGAVFERGRRSVVAAGERVGSRILEVGVGTGLSLPFYSSETRIVGIDISEEMLQRARTRVSERGLHHVEALMVMDAEQLTFPDESFDVVTAQCVVNTVPNPQAALEEFARVLRPDGEIILLNRIGAEAGPRLAFERIFQPIAHRLGWQSDFPWNRFDEWMATSAYDMRVVERRPMPPLGHFSLIRFRKAGVRHPVEENPLEELTVAATI